ncbi:RNA polymerase sigma-70 factor (ECF subfamily) [Sporosarcina luteola]|nr:RNA polymerase sigma-70 factor (ECF subfamily) [Sporosarcina luteola]
MDTECRLENEMIEFYQAHYMDVYRFVMCYSGNREDAEDLTQEVFIRLLRKLPSYDGRSSLRTWIFSIAKHTAIDHYRKNRFSKVFKMSFFNLLPSNAKGPCALAEMNDTKTIVHEAISKLTPAYRTVLILRGINEFSIRETAAILKWSEAKVKVVYHRARKEIESQLNESQLWKEAIPK